MPSIIYTVKQEMKMLHIIVTKVTVNVSLSMRGGSSGIVFLLVAWRITNMTIAFQLAVFALIATSVILLISVPVVFASSVSSQAVGGECDL
ncbi:Photosystem II reaction center protein Z [Apostasia shenzhenica]|uniref:Photosystem II reaction center protein Z n=1 Tax=Apostasia shenzhenica TaxID=1088818 RepID=A0A2I0AIZ1_9ASPA|nr:Photosystem II reaction center protein Z [Apostasia shenzhenica]